MEARLRLLGGGGGVVWWWSEGWGGGGVRGGGALDQRRTPLAGRTPQGLCVGVCLWFLTEVKRHRNPFYSGSRDLKTNTASLFSVNMDDVTTLSIHRHRQRNHVVVTVLSLLSATSCRCLRSNCVTAGWPTGCCVGSVLFLHTTIS